MTQEEQIKIFTANINRIMAEKGLKQNEVAKAIGVAPQTFNNWCKGKSIPRMGKIQTLTEYFHCKNSDLLNSYVPKTEGESLDMNELYDLIMDDSSNLTYNGKDLTPTQRAQAKAIMQAFKNVIDSK